MVDASWEPVELGRAVAASCGNTLESGADCEGKVGESEIDCTLLGLAMLLSARIVSYQ